MYLARELKRLWKMKITVILIVVGVLGTILKGLKERQEELEIRREIETIQTPELV